MKGDHTAMDRGILHWCLQQPGIPYHKLAGLCPDFLVVSPPKTGSSWLAVNLGCHPQVFVPGIKEIKYFSSFFKWLDLNWYLDHFASADGRLKGEASPSYAILPVERIRLIRQLFPKVKLVFLMREPISRAWSHAKHNYRYCEANFATRSRFPGAEFEEPPGGIETVSDEQWGENFIHDWPCASGDYLGQLRRWLSVFPREQMYVGFYESIALRTATTPSRSLHVPADRPGRGPCPFSHLRTGARRSVRRVATGASTVLDASLAGSHSGADGFPPRSIRPGTASGMASDPGPSGADLAILPPGHGSPRVPARNG